MQIILIVTSSESTAQYKKHDQELMEGLHETGQQQPTNNPWGL